ncbi:MmgE/PrpD family protein [Lutimaribacter sp. EGI FJ00014]|uniref:MmgE/PrpD family protein n=1 Tax=Lutimaribacter degradans TaxID=2945989 RepID=A0ACC5ZYR0_9RHOB|nr:MmgE/PrpD family protein [Lutimaribacter sp. EGI FJ00013]MCM2562970.1 MmgE/PrpD family protein [Lutimaribacter sp. EGI FJ00013]MCO0636115.1 MmgE/PrpD family protein [Lutimaribacter sp. EGI FJ00014]
MATIESELTRICCGNIGADVRALARFSLLDWLGCIFAARATPVALAWARALNADRHDVLRSAMSPDRTDAQGAALALGGLGNVLEMDDLHRASILHPGDTVCAAALAVAMRRPTSGPTLLAAIVRGYEIATRIGVAVAAGGYTPFYNSGTCGVFGAAMAAADLHRLGSAHLADALGQAGMQAAGIWQCRLEPGFSKQLATAHAARAGVLSAELGAAGFTGPQAILTGEMGFFKSYYPGADPAAVLDPQPWAISRMSYKPFPACRHAHPAISAALALGADLSSPVQRVDIHTYRAAIDFCDNTAPETADQARFSLQHAVAVALQKGAPEIVDFAPPALQVPATKALRGLVHLHVDPEYDAAFPNQYGARVVATTADSTTHTATCPAAWGDPENPMSEADLIAKFQRNAAHGGLTAKAATNVQEAVLALADAPDLGALAQSLAQSLVPQQETA